jgi:tape measure domain-containing protein
MAAVTTELKVLVKAVGKGEVDKLSKSLNDLGSKAAAPANRQFRELSLELKKIQRNSTQSIANLRGYRNAWRDISEQVKIGSREFKVATENAKRLDAQLQKAEGRGARTGFLGRIGGIKGAAKGVGAIAAGGVFGGFEGAAGAGIGLAVGGPAGAAVGAAIGAQVGGVRQALGGTAEYAASLAKLRIALKGVTTSQQDYENALAFITESTRRFAIPQEIVTRQFTKLQASVQGAGGNLEDTKTAFNGIVAATRATGGSLQDIDSALTATAQVFSKGKVSAEELRQQIGERLPGAFTLFAASMGKTPQELDKALENGEVSLLDFQRFAESIFKKYGETAKVIASSPEAAGDRLAVALSEMQEAVGRILTPIGSAFQEVFRGIVETITAAATALDNFLGISEGAKIERLTARQTALNLELGSLQQDLKLAQKEEKKKPEALLFGGKGAFGQGPGAVDPTQGGAASILLKIAEVEAERNRVTQQLTDAQALIRIREDIKQSRPGTGLSGIVPDLSSAGSGKPTDTTQRMVDLQGRLGEALQDQNHELVAQTQYLIRNEAIAIKFEAGKITALKQSELLQQSLNQLIKDGNRLRKQAKNGAEDFNNTLTKTEQLTKNIATAFRDNMAQGISDVILKARSLQDVLGNVLKMAANMLIQFGVKSMFSAIPGFDKIVDSANGNVFYKNNVVPFARGGIVNKPTLFPMANGAGLMGEAGPEAIMPLRRGPSGRLGVEAAGGGAGNVVVNVDAAGSAVQGDSSSANQLGKAIGAAVQAELIKQKRPGGLLST